MYRHADQSWRRQPSVLSAERRELLARRIGEYAAYAELEEVLVVFHGGEPLLSGLDALATPSRWSAMRCLQALTPRSLSKRTASC